MLPLTLAPESTLYVGLSWLSSPARLPNMPDAFTDGGRVQCKESMDCHVSADMTGYDPFPLLSVGLLTGSVKLSRVIGVGRHVEHLIPMM